MTPASVTLKPGATQRFVASGADAYGNALAPSVAWSASSGTLSPVTGSATTFTPGRPGTTKITATSGKLTAQASVKVKATQAVRVTRITYARRGSRLHVSLAVVDSRRRRVAHASVRLALRRDGRWVASATVRTNSRGLATVTRTARRGCYSVKVARVVTRGLGWNRVTPKNGFCVI